MQARLLLLPLLISASLLAAQTAPAAPDKAAPAKPTATEAKPQKSAQLPPEAPVITIKGGCADSADKTNECKSVVSRAEFEALVHALNPEMPDNVKQSFAQRYANLLVISNEAKRAGELKNPETPLLFEFAKLQVLAQEYGKRLQKEATDVPQAQIDDYYKQHAAEFKAADLQRIIVPKLAASKEKPVDEASEKAYAEKIRQRWVAGEDPAKLQQEAFERAGTKTASPPPVNLGERRRNTLPTDQAAVFDLKAGDVSLPFNDPSAFFIYRVKTLQVQPQTDVQDEIRKNLASERLQAAMDKVTASGQASLNESYFGKPDAPPNPASLAPNRRPAAPKKAAPAPTTAPKSTAPTTTGPKNPK